MKRRKGGKKFVTTVAVQNDNIAVVREEIRGKAEHFFFFFFFFFPFAFCQAETGEGKQKKKFFWLMGSENRTMRGKKLSEVKKIWEKKYFWELPTTAAHCISTIRVLLLYNSMYKGGTAGTQAN